MNSVLSSLLRGRYPSQAYALFFEVQSATAYQGSQRADAVAMGLWPSRGLDIIGFEYKAHRGDWLRELRDPKKAEEIFQFCNHWNLVADGHTARIEEIPATWGWLRVEGSRLRTAKEPPKLSPCALSHVFVASLLRSAQKDRDDAVNRPRQEIEQEVRTELVADFQEKLAEMTKRLDERTTKFNNEQRRIEDALGIHFGNWSTPIEKVGAALRLVMADRSGLRCRLAEAKQQIDTISRELSEAEKGLAEWPEAKP